jgi:hypothetical protein
MPPPLAAALQVASLEGDRPRMPAGERLQARYSLVRAAGVLELSWEPPGAAGGGGGWLQAVAALQWSGSKMCHDRRLYEAGLRLLRRYEPGLSVEPDVDGSGQQVFPWPEAGGSGESAAGTGAVGAA